MSVWRGARLSCNYIGRHLDFLTLPTSDRRSQRPPPGTIAYPPALQGRHWGQGRWPAVGWPARCASRSRSAPGVRLRSDFWVVGESWGPWCWRREICCSSSNEKRIGTTLSFSAARCRRSGLRVDISPCLPPAAAVHSNLAPAGRLVNGGSFFAKRKNVPRKPSCLTRISGANLFSIDFAVPSKWAGPSRAKHFFGESIDGPPGRRRQV